jgi:hypothetical protein
MQLDRRRNIELARAIDSAILLDASVSAVHAWTTLDQLGVKRSCIPRLLGIKGQRRRRASMPARPAVPVHCRK